MGKIIFALSLVFGLSVTQFAYAQCDTYVGRSQGTSQTTSATRCTDTGNLGAYNGSQGGSGGSGYGPNYYPPEYYTQIEINRQNCRAQIDANVGNSCAERQTAVLRDSISSCNTGIAVGTVAGVVGTVGLTVLGFATAPVSLPVLVVGTAVFSILGIGGGYVAIESANQCKDVAKWNDEDNTKICANAVKDAKSLACNF